MTSHPDTAPNPSQLKRHLIKYVNRNTPIQIRLALLFMGLAALFNPGQVVVETYVQCVKRRDELPNDVKELFSYMAKPKE